MLASIIIRTFNEQRYLADLFQSIGEQVTDGLSYEVVLVDSGSTDRTVSIAEEWGARILHVNKAQFSFGRSLNLGCAAARGDFLVFISGHCVPRDSQWLARLTEPLREGDIAYTYGRQIGGPDTKFSEARLFEKFYPLESRVPQSGFFCNNANAALRRSAWEAFRFDEELTGLEDMHLAKRLVDAQLRIGYVAGAVVHHYHHESWSSICRRYEREAIALRHILPEVHVTFPDFVRYFGSAVLHDLIAAGPRQASSVVGEIVLFRLMQFWGSYRGSHEHRQLSQAQKERYFYPKGGANQVVELATSAVPTPPRGVEPLTHSTLQ